MEISIHALREEGDRHCLPRATASINFYPRPPRGGRPKQATGYEDAKVFLSTPSARRATLLHGGDVYPQSISIHALREEGDARGFAPRAKVCISIHALREEGDWARP